MFCISLIANIFRFRMVQMKKWALLTFHAAMVVIIIGAGITRYFGYEGMMHIREGDQSNSFLSADTYLVFEAMKGGKKYKFDEPVMFATLGDNTFEEEYSIAGQEVKIEVLDFMPNPTEALVDDDNGVPDKNNDTDHSPDAIGYFIHRRWPLDGMRRLRQAGNYK